MPKLKEYLLNRYVELIARTAWKKTGSAELSSNYSLQDPAQEEIQKLLGLLKDRNDLIRRLKQADNKRNALWKRLRQKLIQKKKECAKVHRRNNVYRKVLQRRRYIIRDLSQRLRLADKPLLSLYEAPHLLPPKDAGKPLPGGLTSSLLSRLVNFIPAIIWRHWMRLGVLKQFEARPMSYDRLPLPKLPLEQLPKISVVTPSYNQKDFLEETMLSVLDQQYPHLEYLVMDGGSDDGSVEIIKKHAAKLKHWQSAKDNGQAEAVRNGLLMASGDIMAWLNSDDLFLPGTLAYVADYFARHPEVDVVYGHRLAINESSYEIGRWVLPSHDPDLLPWADFIPQETCFWRREIYEKIDGMDPNFQFALDWDLLLRLQKAGAKMVRLPYFLGAFRLHCQQKNAVTINVHGYKEMQLLRKRELGSEFNRGGLAKRVNHAQLKALLTTLLMRIGIRR